MDTDQQGLV